MGARPAAIVLTHGHADHSGSAKELSELWGVPIFAHRLELPFLTGRSAYPPPDPTVGGPFAFMTRFMPNRTLDLGGRVRELPPDGEMPGIERWRWVHTPGHTPGHIALLRPEDATLLGGDALATLDADSLLGMITRKQKISRPATPITPDWRAAEASVRKIASLEPRVLACGHGDHMTGHRLTEQLFALRGLSDVRAGRYVDEAARFDEHGVKRLPPAPPDPLPRVAVGVGALLLAVVAVAVRIRRRRSIY